MYTHPGMLINCRFGGGSKGRELNFVIQQTARYCLVGVMRDGEIRGGKQRRSQARGIAQRATAIHRL